MYGARAKPTRPKSGIKEENGLKLDNIPVIGQFLGSQNPSPDEKNPGKFRAICQLADTTSRDALNTFI